MRSVFYLQEGYMRKIIIILCCVLVFTGCGAAPQQNTVTDTEVPSGTEEILPKTPATEEILLKYQSSLEDFLTQHLNVLLDLYDLSGRYEPPPPLIHAVKWLEGKMGIHSFKLKLFNILGYHSLCKINHLIHRIYRHP